MTRTEFNGRYTPEVPMMPPRLRLTVALTSTLALGCGTDEECEAPNVTVAQLAGGWEAAHFTIAKPGTTTLVDVLSQGGSATITIAATGRFSSLLVFPDQSQESSIGTLRIECLGEVAVIDDAAPGVVEYLDFVYSGHAFQVFFDDSFDFDGDGTAEPAVFNLLFERA